MHRPLLQSLLAALLICASDTAVFAQHPTTAEQIIELDKTLNQLIVAHDVATARTLYDDEFVLTVAGGAKRKADMLADIGNPAVALTICETTDVTVRVRGTTAVLTGTLQQAGTVNGKPIDVKLRVTDTWVNVDGKWLLFAGHASVAK